MKFRSLRFACDTPVRVRAGEREILCHMRNVSQTGARLTGLEELEPGQRISIVTFGHRLQAQITRQHDGLTGCRFALPLSKKELTDLRGLTGAGSAKFAMPSHGFAQR